MTVTASTAPRIVVLGQIGQDLAVRLDAPPEPGSSHHARDARWLPGGKGANQAVALAQLGGRVALIGVVGDDAVGRGLTDALIGDGIDVCAVARRGASAVLVDVVGPDADRLLMEHVPSTSLVAEGDVDAAQALYARADVACLQAQEPAAVLIRAARIAAAHGCTVAVDGAVPAAAVDEVLSLADVVRLDAREGEQLAGQPVDGLDAASAAAGAVRTRGPEVVAIEVPGRGDLVVWADGEHLYEHGDETVIDRTGAGDAFFAGLVLGLARGESAQRAGELAGAAAAATVSRLGGRPDLRHLAPQSR